QQDQYLYHHHGAPPLRAWRSACRGGHAGTASGGALLPHVTPQRGLARRCAWPDHRHDWCFLCLCQICQALGTPARWPATTREVRQPLGHTLDMPAPRVRLRRCQLRSILSMHIVVMGSGGLGGYFGGLLARSGADVTFIARGANLHALQERGLTVHSVNGDFALPVQACADPGGLPPADAILFCVKTY